MAAAIASPAEIEVNTSGSVYTAISAPNRRRILRLIAGGRCRVGDLSETLVQRQQAISHHVTILRLAGAVEWTRDGKEIRYKLSRVGMAAIRAMDLIEAGG